MRIRYSSNVTLQADTYYPLLIYFGERTGGDRIDFGWQGPGQGLDNQYEWCSLS